MYQFLDELKVIGGAMKDIPNLKQINDVIRNKPGIHQTCLYVLVLTVG
jgi:hypothetical protein